MKKIIAAGLFCIAISFLTMTALAHSPAAIEGVYDADRGELSITVQHLVNDPKTHFVKKVTISKDGKEVAKREFDFQTSHRNQTMPPFKLPASVGERFDVIAECNISGKYEISIEVKDEKPDVRKLN